MGVQGSRAHQDASFEHHAGSVGPSNVWVFSFLRKEAFQYFWCLPIIFWSYSKKNSGGCSSRQRASFLFLVNFWVSWKTYLKNALKHLQKCFKHIIKWEKGMLFHNKVKKMLKKGQRVKTPKTKSPKKTRKEALGLFSLKLRRRHQGGAPVCPLNLEL